MSEPRPDDVPLDIALLTLRAMFFVSAVGVGLYLARLGDNEALQYPAMLVAGILSLLIIFVDMTAVAKSSIATVSAIVFGLLIGFLAAQLFIGIVSLLGDFETPEGKRVLGGIRLALTLIFCYLGPAYILRTKDDLRFIVPYVEFQRQGNVSVPLILDTSAIIDGRVVEMAMAQMFDAPFVVPSYVIEELQRIADNSDKNRRARGRRGLDKLKQLRELPQIEVELPKALIVEDPNQEVDRRLIQLTNARGGKLVTVDFNLQKVCELEGVPVLNLNEAAKALRPQHLPGDAVSIRIVRPGENPNQGVGYLEDGTMVVVENGREHKGRTIPTVVTSSIQSSAGQMIFARYTPDVVSEEAAAAPAPSVPAEPEPDPEGSVA